MLHRPLVLVIAVVALASCGGRPEGGRVRADAVLDALVSASVCDLDLLKDVVELGGRPPLATDEPLFSPIYMAAGYGLGDVRATGEEPVDPGRVAVRCLAQATKNAKPGSPRAPLFLRDQMQDLEFTQQGENVEGRVVLRVGDQYEVDCEFQLKVVAGRLEPVSLRMPRSGLAIGREVGSKFRPTIEKPDRDG